MKPIGNEPCAWCGRPKREHEDKVRVGDEGLYPCPGTLSQYWTPVPKPQAEVDRR